MNNNNPQTASFDTLEVPHELHLIFEDIIHAWKDGCVVSIQRNNPALNFQSSQDLDEKKILIKIMPASLSNS